MKSAKSLIPSTRVLLGLEIDVPEHIRTLPDQQVSGPVSFILKTDKAPKEALQK